MSLRCPQCQSVLEMPADLHQSGEEFLCTQCHRLLRLTMTVSIIEHTHGAPIETPGPTPAMQVVAAFHGEGSLELAKELLGPAGYHVIPARTGREVLACVDSHQPGIVILGDDLPDLSGLDVCELLKRSKRHPGLRVLRVITGRESPNGDNDNTLLYGPDGQLTRSALYRELQTKVQVLLQERANEHGKTADPQPRRADPDATRLMTPPKGPSQG